MRQTKFRAKSIRPDTGEHIKWVYGDYFSQRKNGYVRHYIIEHDVTLPQDVMWEVDPGTLGEYTGIHSNKNGLGIFEGDITNYGVVEYRTNLNWDSGGSIHPGFYFTEAYEYRNPGDLSYHTGFGDCQVLGNIIDNPELLK